MKNLFFLIFLMLFSCSQTPVLKEKSFGELPLEKYTEASLIDQLNLYFPEEKIKISQAAQDGPIYTKVEFGNIGYFKIENDRLKEFYIEDSSFFDQYGAHVGLSAATLFKIRPEIEIQRDYHHINARYPDSNIYYQLSGGPENKPQSSYSQEEIDRMTLSLIIWKPE